MKDCLRKNALLLFITVLITIIISAASVYIAIILKKVTDVAISGDMTEFRKVLLNTAIFLLLLGVFSYGYSICSKILTRNVVVLLRQRIFEGVMRRNFQDFTKVNTADYLSAFTNDIKLIEENFLQPLLMTIQNTVIFIATIVMLFIINYIIALCLIGFLALMLIIPSLFGKALQNRQDNFSKKISQFTCKLKDILSGYEVIKSYNIGKHIKSEFNNMNNESATAKFHADRLIAASEGISGVLAYFTLFASFFIGAYLVIKGSITAGTLLAILQLSSSFVNPIMMIMQSIPKMQGVKPVLSRVSELTDYKDNSFTGKNLPSFEEGIAVKNLSFSYNNDQVVLQNIGLHIRKGKKYAVVGHSGCGKTTLAKLLTGYYSNFEGTINYDSTDIRELDIEKLNQKISLIHQNIYMFDDSIKQNIFLYEDYKDHETESALSASGVNKFLPQTSSGLSTPVGENGCNLSGGQRQRIAVARALIQKKPILIIDEGTSAIDMQTAYDIESSLLKMDNLTVVTITHNMNTDLLGLYDCIIYMENGRIVETGNLNELLSKQSSFSRFVSLEKQ